MMMISFQDLPKSIIKDKIEQSKNLLLCLFCVVRRRMTCETGNVCFRETKCIRIRSHIAIFFDLCCCEMVVWLSLASSRSQWIHWLSELVGWTLKGVHASISAVYSAIVAMQRLGKRFISGFAGSSKKGLSEVEKDANYKRLAKFKESAWKFVYYLTAEILALTITYNEPWFTDTKQFWIGPDQQCWPDQKAK